ncbi:MAG: Holliday junction resolvase RuvX [Clostridia bacterium]|nr:Holliday junction resolvase RuvX [Clostridia bacterium]
MVYICFDYGDRRTGVAISDASAFLAGGLCTINMPSMTRTAEEAVRLAKKHGAEEAVVGLPLNMDGTEGARAETAHAFGDMLIRLSDGYIKAVHYCDERLSTVEAHGILSFSNVHSKKRKKVIDTLSAELILQYFLDEKRKNKQ